MCGDVVLLAVCGGRQVLFACKLRFAAGADSTPTAVSKKDRGMHLDSNHYSNPHIKNT
jgi:hypothetical protein